jgi:hypothetical protein
VCTSASDTTPAISIARREVYMRSLAMSQSRTPSFEPATGEREALLALAQRRLGLPALGDVDGRAGHALGAAVGVAEALGAVQHPAHLAVAHDAVLDVEPRRRAGDVLAHGLLDPRVVVAHDRHLREELGERRHALPGRQVEQLGEALGDVDLVGVDVPHPVALRASRSSRSRSVPRRRAGASSARFSRRCR